MPGAVNEFSPLIRLTDGMKQTLNEAIHQLEVMHD